MPKLKTKKGAAKRFRKISDVSFKHRSANRAHINTKMTTKRKRHLRSTSQIKKADILTLHRQLPFA